METGYEIKLEKSTENHKSSHGKKIVKFLSNVKTYIFITVIVILLIWLIPVLPLTKLTTQLAF